MKPTTIDEYIASKPEGVRPRLQEIREIIRSRLPESGEAVKLGRGGHPASGWDDPGYLCRV